MATENTMANYLEEAVRRCEELSIWMKGFHNGFFGATPETPKQEEPTTEDEPTEEPATEETVPEHRADEKTAIKELTPEEKFNNPNPGVYSFVPPEELVAQMDQYIAELMNPDNEPDQTRGRVRDICDVALEMAADTVVDICESFTQGDATRAQVAAAASEALNNFVVETRKKRLIEDFETFCKEKVTTPQEMLEILS